MVLSFLKMREPFLCQRPKNGCDIIFDRYYYIFNSEYFNYLLLNINI